MLGSKALKSGVRAQGVGQAVGVGPCRMCWNLLRGFRCGVDRGRCSHELRHGIVGTLSRETVGLSGVELLVLPNSGLRSQVA